VKISEQGRIKAEHSRRKAHTHTRFFTPSSKVSLISDRTKANNFDWRTGFVANLPHAVVNRGSERVENGTFACSENRGVINISLRSTKWGVSL
jgi:hypothetical protein